MGKATFLCKSSIYICTYIIIYYIHMYIYLPPRYTIHQWISNWKVDVSIANARFTVELPVQCWSAIVFTHCLLQVPGFWKRPKFVWKLREQHPVPVAWHLISSMKTPILGGKNPPFSDTLSFFSSCIRWNPEYIEYMPWNPWNPNSSLINFHNYRSEVYKLIIESLGPHSCQMGMESTVGYEKAIWFIGQDLASGNST